MCKTPAPECKPLKDGDVPMEEENPPDDMSEEETEDEDSDTTYFNTSSEDNRSRSDTDAESASGNRVTPEMVVWLMLRERGLISDERYARMTGTHRTDYKSLMPVIPKSYLSDSEVGDDELEDSDVENEEVDIPLVNVQDGNTVGINKSEVRQEIGEIAQNGAVKENVNDTVSDNNANKRSANIILGKETDSDVSPKKSKNEEVQIEQEQEPLIQTGKQEVRQQKETTDKPQTQSKREESQEHQQNVNEEENREYVKDTVMSDNVNKRTAGIILRQEADSDVSQEKSKKEEMQIVQEQEPLIQTIKQEVSEEMKTMNKPQTESKQKDLCLEHPQQSDTEKDTGSKDSAPGPDVVLDHVYLVSTDIKKITHTEELKKPSEDHNIATENNLNILNINNSKQNQNDEICNNGKGKQDKTVKNVASGKKTSSYMDILKTLIIEKRIVEKKDERYGPGFAAVLKTFARGLDEDYDTSDDDDDSNYCLQSFALFLNFYSPSAYKYVTETFDTPLPDHKTLCSWYLKDSDDPGLSGKAFKILKEKSSKKRQTCALMFCDIYLKCDGDCCHSCDGSTQVDYGGGAIEDTTDKAVLVYVFILVSLDEDWKMPIGYIFARSILAETQAELIKMCLTQCHDAGVDVVAVTLEKLTPAMFLGCSFDDPRNMKTTFKHPACDREVAVWIDPCLAIKSARHTLKVKGVLHDGKGDTMRWKLIRRLRRFHGYNDITFDNSDKLQFRNHIAKIGLTSETFSRTLAAALRVGGELFPQEFTDVTATRKYVLCINYLYDVFNSKANFEDVSHHLQRAKKYLLGVFFDRKNELSLFDDDNLKWNQTYGYRHLIEGKYPSGIIGFLICIQSYKHLHATLVKEQTLDFLDTQRLCKIHAEDFVKSLRAHTYSDPDRFTGECFQEYYKRLFNILVKNPHFTDRNVSLEHWPLTKTYPPAHLIKVTSGKREYDDVYSGQYALNRLRKTSRNDMATQYVQIYSRELDSEQDVSARKNMVGYLAGWIAARFARYLRCEDCIDALLTHKKLSFHECITLKRMNRVCLPSKVLFRICWECERVLRLSGLKGPPAKLSCLILRRLAPRLPWKRANHHPGHDLQLTRLVIAKYIPLRIKAPFSVKEKNRIIEKFRDTARAAKEEMFEEIEDIIDDGAWSVEDSDFES